MMPPRQTLITGRAKSANFLEAGQEYFLDMFVLVWPPSRARQLSTEVEYVRREGRNGVTAGTPHPLLLFTFGALRRGRTLVWT